MTGFSNFDDVSICCLSFQRNMNLRKLRSSSEQKGALPCKDIKSSVGKRKKSSRYSENKNSSKNLPKSPVKYQKSDLDDFSMVKTSDINFVTSTPVSQEVRKRVLRSSSKHDTDEVFKLNSFKRIPCPIISKPTQKIVMQIKPCEVRLIPIKNTRKRSSNKSKSVEILPSKKRSFSSKLSHSLLNSSVGALKENVGSTRNSMVLRSQNASKKMANDIENSVSEKSSYTRKTSVLSQKHLTNRQKLMEKIIVPLSEIQSENKKKYTRKSASCGEKPAFCISSMSKDMSSISDKSNEKSIAKKSLVEVCQTPKVSLLQSYHEIDNTKSSTYNFRSSTVPKKRTYSKKKTGNKKMSSTHAETSDVSLSSTPKYFNSISAKSYAIKRKKVFDREASQHSQINLSKSSNEIKTPKPSRCSLRLQKQKSHERVSDNRLSTKSSLISQSQDIIKMAKYQLEPKSKNTKRSKCISSEKGQLSKKTTANKSSSQSSVTLQSQHSMKQQKLAKKAQHQDKTSKSCRMPSSSSKKQMSSEKSNDKFLRECLSFPGDIPIDDLALSVRSYEGRKVKSDGFKLPGKNILKRKRCAIAAINKADEDYEDDIYESKKFDKFKDLLLDTSDSEGSFSISTPKFPCTPLTRHKTPKFRDCFSPTEYAISRKAAMEYIYRNKRRKSVQKPETPVIAEKKKLEFSQALEDANKLQKTIESLAEEESDNDSYFSFC